MWIERIIYTKWIPDFIAGRIFIYKKNDIFNIIVNDLNDDCFLIQCKSKNDLDSYKIIADTIQNYYVHNAYYEEIIHLEEYNHDITDIKTYEGVLTDDIFKFEIPPNYMDKNYT
jgi:hypothetical protein